MKKLCLLAGLTLFALGCDRGGPDAPLGGPDDPITAAETADRENTALNQRDAGGSRVTPLDQSNEKPDIDLVAEIRRRVLDIENLSVNGQNVKIITNQGRVVLRGPVESVQERQAIASIANELVGETKVTDQLEVDRD